MISGNSQRLLEIVRPNLLKKLEFPEGGGSSSMETQGQKGAEKSTGCKSGKNWRHGKVFKRWEKFPGNSVSTDHFQMAAGVLGPEWAEKILCIILPNRRTAEQKTLSVPGFPRIGEVQIQEKYLGVGMDIFWKNTLQIVVPFSQLYQR